MIEWLRTKLEAKAVLSFNIEMGQYWIFKYKINYEHYLGFFLVGLLFFSNNILKGGRGIKPCCIGFSWDLRNLCQWWNFFMSFREMVKSPIGILICIALQIFAAFVDIIAVTGPFWVADLFHFSVWPIIFSFLQQKTWMSLHNLLFSSLTSWFKKCWPIHCLHIKALQMIKNSLYYSLGTDIWKMHLIIMASENQGSPKLCHTS